MFNIEFWAISIFIQVLVIVVSHMHWMTLKINLKDYTIYIFDSIAYRAADQGWRKKMKYHAPQSDSLVPYAAGWLSTSDGYLQSNPGT